MCIRDSLEVSHVLGAHGPVEQPVQRRLQRVHPNNAVARFRVWLPQVIFVSIAPIKLLVWISEGDEGEDSFKDSLVSLDH